MVRICVAFINIPDLCTLTYFYETLMHHFLFFLCLSLPYCLLFLQACGQLLGKGWPLGSFVVACFLVFWSLSHTLSGVSFCA